MADLVQIEVGTSYTPIVEFQYNGAPKDLDGAGTVPVVTLTKPDGTAGPASGTVSHVGGVDSGQYSFVVAAQPEVTWLDYTAVGTIGGQPQTLRGRVEWVGAALFNLSAFRALRVANGTPFSLTAVPLYSDRQIMAKRTAVLDELHAILGFYPVPRLARETHSADGSWGIVLHEHKPLRLISVTVAGTAQVLTGYYLHPAGILRPVSGYLPGPSISYGVGNVVVEYVAGWERPLGECSDAAMIWAAKSLNPSGFTNATTISTPDGSTYTYERRGGFTGVADLDRWLERHRSVAGVA
jgi:hypothetical protein